MSTFTSSKDQLLAALRQYTEFLEERKGALHELSSTSNQMLQSLQNDPDADITTVLRKRGDHSRIFSETTARNRISEDISLELARQAAKASSQEIKALAQNALSLHGDSQVLAEEVLIRQNECETILKARLQSIAEAIKESKQRRKFDAAYGPAFSHKSPIFLDTQK